MKLAIYMMAFILAAGFVSCNKEKLDLKPDQSLAIPKTIDEYQSLFDNGGSINLSQWGYMAELSSDNYFIPYTTWNSMSSPYKFSYVWDKDPFRGESPLEWQQIYTIIYTSNIVLEGLEKFKDQADTRKYKTARGCALFYRGFGFYQLAQVFCKPYNQASAANDLGLPLTKDSDPFTKEPRATVAATYDQITADLKESLVLIDSFNTVTPFPTRPTKAVVSAALSRVYISMRQYDNALPYANISLSLNNSLIDYNTLLPVKPQPITQYPVEVIWHATGIGNSVFTLINNSPVDTTLYKSYSDGDLRKAVFFIKNPSSGNMTFQGSYSGSISSQFAGIATDEVYLNRAECYARAGKANEALADLNTLMRKRWKNDGSFIDFTASSPQEALGIILTERRKELIYRGLRWTDLRRLNLDGANITLTRALNGVYYTLAPNSLNYVLPLPKSEFDYNSIPQNERE